MDLVGRVTPIEYERQTEDSTPEPQFTVGRLVMKVSAQSREQAALVSSLVMVFRLVRFARAAKYLSLQGSYK